MLTETEFDAALDAPLSPPAPVGEAPAHAEPEHVEQVDASSESETQPSPESEAGRTLANARKAKDPEKRKQSIQNEINALTREKGDTARERDAIRSELAALRAERDALKAPRAEPAPKAPAGDLEPTEDQFETYGAYVKAQARWEARQEIKAVRESDARARQQHAQQRSQSERLTKHGERLDAFRATRADFDDVMASASELPFNRPMQEAIFRSEQGPAMLLYLAEHQDDHRRIYALRDPLDAFGEMRKLEARLDAASTGPAPVVNVSQAKPPLKPVGSAPSTGDKTDATEDMDVDEFIRVGNAAERKRRGR